MQNRKILIPLDGSEFRNQTLSLIQQMFDPHNTEIFLLLVESRRGNIDGSTAHYYAYAGDMWYYPYDDVINNVTEARAKALADQRAQLHKDVLALRKAGYTVSSKTCTGELAPTIVREAQTAHVNAIAMVTHGRTGLNRMLNGSVADEVLRKASVPVMMMRSPIPLAHPPGPSVGEMGY